jgi:diaminopimelate decarboxylase
MIGYDWKSKLSSVRAAFEPFWSVHMFDTAWWQRDDLGYRGGRLHFAGADLQALAQKTGTPAFVYSSARVRANLERMKAALAGAGVRHRVFYALKANRFSPLLAAMRSWNLCGIDACSPAEMLYALRHGFDEADISFTGHAVSNADLDAFARHPGVHVNCDALSTIRRLGERCPGRPIGIRINPRVGAGYNERLHYAGTRPSKFGIYQDRFDEALELAASFGMRVTQIHLHFGSGYLKRDLPQLDQAMEDAGRLVDRCPDVDTLDIGGGMGVRITMEHSELDLEQWAALIARHVNGRGLKVHLEPGDYLVKDAGALLCEVNTVENKGGVNFAGVNAGLNLQNLWAYYQTPFVVAALAPRRVDDCETYTVTGNINEAIDLLAEDVVLPTLREGDCIALLNAGGYGSSAASNHCMRGRFSEYLLE